MLDTIIVARTRQIKDVQPEENWTVLLVEPIDGGGVRELVWSDDGKIIERKRRGDEVFNLRAIKIHLSATPIAMHEKLFLFLDADSEVEDKDVWMRCFP